jgi:hypothetical protein
VHPQDGNEYKQVGDKDDEDREQGIESHYRKNNHLTNGGV